MKAVALCVLAFGVFTGVRAGDSSDDTEQQGAEGGAVQMPVQPEVAAGSEWEILNNPDSIDWNLYSPAALGMHLNYDEMTMEQLREVAEAFVMLGLIGPEEVEDFVAALQDPRMRRMIKGVLDRWPETMKRVMKDPRYRMFLQEFEGGFSEDVLAKIVGMKGGLAQAARNIQERAEREEGAGSSSDE